ncbi:MAG: PD-(D/E)XK nuclease domain-containing protein [Lachnospiraceae bacterium]|nr:PD-(D/E)XK nuclease domain-containing protein [Lachnospiraceae bacterium]
MQLEPRDKSKPGYLLEFKADKDIKIQEMEERASEALQQIKSKSYAADLKYRGVRNIISYGIAFS